MIDKQYQYIINWKWASQLCQQKETGKKNYIYKYQPITKEAINICILKVATLSKCVTETKCYILCTALGINSKEINDNQ